MSSNKIVAIMQPTYLPWYGYFNLINSVDEFVFLDDVQLSKRSWQTRNRILSGTEEVVLTVPIKKSPRETLLCDVEISEHGGWREEHIKSLERAYSKNVGWDELGDIIAIIASNEFRKLVDLNCTIIETLSQTLGIATQFYRATDLRCGGKRSEHLVEICRKLGAKTYLSPRGSSDYLEEDKVFCSSEGMPNLCYQLFFVRPYSQGNDTFVSHLSILDLIANLGSDRAREYLVG